MDWRINFCRECDSLDIRDGPPRPGHNVDISSRIMGRIGLRPGILFGFEIENFEALFLPEVPALARLWAPIRGSFRDEVDVPATAFPEFAAALLDYLAAIPAPARRRSDPRRRRKAYR